MSSTIVNTMIGFGLEEDQATKIAEDFATLHDELAKELAWKSREIDRLVSEFNELEARAKLMEAALAEETHDSAAVVPFHVGGGQTK